MDFDLGAISMNPRDPSLPCKFVRQEKFAQLLAAGGRVKESYIQAGYADGHHAAQNANKLKNKIRPRISFLEKQRAADHAKAREAAIKESAVNKGWVLQQLRETVERAMEPIPVLDRHGKPTGVFRYERGMAIRALHLIGKELGLFQTPWEDPFVQDRRRFEAMSEEERLAENRQFLDQARQKIRAYKATLAEEGEPHSNRPNGGQGSACPGEEVAQESPSQVGCHASPAPRPRRHSVPTYIMDHLASKRLF
jgi:hypothetical protein